MVNYRWLAITLFSQGNFSLTYPEKVVFTPHQMEWQRLSHLPIEQQTLVNNQRQQAKLGSTIVLKSSHNNFPRRRTFSKYRWQPWDGYWRNWGYQAASFFGFSSV